MKGNPITRKDLTITSRSMRYSWGLFAYEGILTIVFLFALSILGFSGRYYVSDQAENFSRFIAMFPVVSVAELIIVALIVPITTATAINGEKERQTFDIMLTTQIRPISIILGKMFSAVIRIMVYVIASIPIMAVAFTIGGISWWALIFYLLLVLVVAMFEAAVGVFCSTVCNRGITAILMSYVILAIIYGATFIPLFISFLVEEFSNMTGVFTEDLLYSVSTIILLPNPIITFVEFYTQMLAGESLLMKELTNQCFDFFEFFAWKGVWIILSSAVILLLTWMFVMLSTYKVNPLHTKKAKG